MATPRPEPSVLLVEADANVAAAMISALWGAAWSVRHAASGAEALSVLATSPPMDAVVSALELRQTPDGLTVLREARRRWPEATLLLMAAAGAPASGVAPGVHVVPRRAEAETVSRLGAEHARRARLRSARARADRPDASAPKRRTILVVDDDDDTRAIVRGVLEDEGFAVAEAVNGKEALERLRSDPAPAMVLLDLIMPELSGWEVMATLATDPALSSVPVTVMTAARAPFDLAGRRGEVLTKPLALERLLDVVSAALGRAPERKTG
jgi:CheY-like chemotaxis protein